MAVIRKNWLELSGSCDGFIFYRRKDKNCIRRRSLKRRDSSMPAQLIQRQRMKDVVKMYQAIRTTDVYKVWKQLARQSSHSVYNLFVKHNIRAFDGEGRIVFERLHFSVGGLPLPVEMRVERTEREGVWILWQNPGVLPHEKASDRLLVVVVYEDASFSWFGPDEFTYCRAQRRAWLPLAEQEGCHHLYCFFATEEFKEFSDDVYLKVI